MILQLRSYMIFMFLHYFFLTDKNKMIRTKLGCRKLTTDVPAIEMRLLLPCLDVVLKAYGHDIYIYINKPLGLPVSWFIFLISHVLYTLRIHNYNLLLYYNFLIYV